MTVWTFCFAVEASDVRWLRLRSSAALQVGPRAATIMAAVSSRWEKTWHLKQQKE